MIFSSFNRLTLCFCCLLFVVSGATQTLQRSSISAFGNSVNTDGLYLSQTAGQDIAYTQATEQNARLLQGFEQSFEIAGSKNKRKNLVVSVYPNPNNGKFNLSIQGLRAEVIDYTIYDASGKPIHSDKGELNSIGQIQLAQNVSPGTYLIKVVDEHQNIGQSKIIIQ